MALGEGGARSRRSLLATAVASVVGATMASVAKPLRADAATGDAMVAGTAKDAANATTFTATTGISTDVVALNTVGAGAGAGVSELAWCR